MIATCFVCKKQFNAARSDVKTCSPACRMKWSRKRNKSKTPIEDVTDSVVTDISTVPANFGEEDCECVHCQNNRHNKSKKIINHGSYKSKNELGPDEVNRVSLPGDADYHGCMKDKPQFKE